MPQAEGSQATEPQGNSDAQSAESTGSTSSGSAASVPQPANSSSANNAESTASENTVTPWIHVSGGSITVVNDSGRDADGLDSNGDIIITDGTIRVSMLGDGSNSAIDYGSESGGVCQINGGNVVACGGSSMAEGFDSSSSQCSVLYGYSAGAPAGTTVSVLDASGNTLLSYEVPCSFTSVNVSCPEMIQGQTYTIAIGDTSEEVTLSEVALSSGDTQSGSFGGGPAQGGGMRQHNGDNADEGNMQSGDTQTGDRQQPSQDTQPGRGMPGEQGSTKTDAPDSLDDATNSDATASVDKSYTTETLVICGISMGVLAIGLAVAALFRRR